jgi:hypothetical protein
MVIHQAAEAVRVTVLVARALDQLGVPHAIVGSLASSLHGVPRSTNDVDIVADLRREHADALASALGDAFYVDSDMIRDAIDRRSEFNVIHLGTMFKVDVFVPALDRVSRAQIDRAAIVTVDSEAGHDLRVASAEDTVAQKLLWYRRGGESSERQWLDTLGVIAVQGKNLDVTYLRQTTNALGVEDLLDRALVDSAAGPPAT